MKPFTFSLMLLLQHVDEALRLERRKSAGDAATVARLGRRKRQIADRLKRSLPMIALARG
jgi:hypothetical protein